MGTWLIKYAITRVGYLTAPLSFSRLDTIWHDVHTEGDEPNKCMWIIAECERDYRTVYWGSLKDCTWEEYVTHHVVTRWAYIDDLFPKD